VALYTPASTVLLLHGDGANASTTFTDSSYNAKIVTAVGSAQISTAQSKFGGASMYFDGASYATTPAHADFALGAGYFTEEVWVYPTNAAAGTNFYGTFYQNITGQNQIGTAANATVNLALANMRPTATIFTAANTNVGAITAASTIAVNAWSHLAYVRSGSAFTLFVNGAVAGTATSAEACNTSTRVMPIGADSTGNCKFQGYIDDLRITKQALYTAAFTPPTAPLEPFNPVQINIQLFDPGIYKLCKYDPSQPKPVIQEVTQDLQDRLPYGLWTTPAAAAPFEFKGRGQITGTTKEAALPSNAPLSRLVRLHREPDGMFVKATWSDAAGNYTFNGLRPDCKYTITSYDYTGQYRAVIADNITPTPL